MSKSHAALDQHQKLDYLVMAYPAMLVQTSDCSGVVHDWVAGEAE